MAVYIDRRESFGRKLKNFFESYPKAITFWTFLFMFLLSTYLAFFTDYSERKTTRVQTQITVVDKIRKNDDYIIMYKVEGSDKIIEKDIEPVIYNRVNPNKAKGITNTISNIMIAPQEYEGKGWRHLFLAMVWFFGILLLVRIMTILE